MQTSTESVRSAATASRRLRRVADGVVAGLVPLRVAPCASITHLEGEAIGRFSAVQVVFLEVGERGVQLAERSKVELLFQERGLKPIWIDCIAQVPADAEVLVTTGTPVGEEVIAKMPKLKLIASAFTGVDHVDIAACGVRKIKVANVPDYSTDATAELVLGLVLSHLRKLPQCAQVIQNGQWTAPPQEDLQGKTIGIVGTGKIGIRLAELFKAFKVKSIVGHSLMQDKEFATFGGKYVETLAALFLEADIICVCVPLNNDTEGLISAKLMKLLRPHCLLVNVSRGSVVDEVAMAVLLNQGSFCAALDVFGWEPLPANDPLRSVPTEALAMTPHVGYQSKMSLERRIDTTLKNILAFLAGQPTNLVQ